MLTTITAITTGVVAAAAGEIVKEVLNWKENKIMAVVTTAAVAKAIGDGIVAGLGIAAKGIIL